MLHDFLYVKITILYAISTHKNSVIITKKMLFEMHQYDIKINMSLLHGSLAVHRLSFNFTLSFVEYMREYGNFEYLVCIVTS